MRIKVIWVCLLLCCSALRASPQNPPNTKQQSAPQQKTETFWHKVLRVSGIGASPSTLKGPGDEVVHGQIWIADIGTHKVRKLTSGGGFCSPVFMKGGNDILALKDAKVVRVSLSDGRVTSLYAAAGITKLVGLNMDDPDKVLVIVRGSASRPDVAFLYVSSGKLDPLSYDRSSDDDRHMVEHLSAWDRDYGGTSVYINQQNKSGMSGTLSWTDVFLKSGSNAPIDVSKCDGVNCGQPSLSPDGKLVAYVRADEE